MLAFIFTLYIYYTKIFIKNQKRPPHGKPHSIIRVAGGIMGEKSFAPPIPFLRGLFRVEMVCEFAVIVAVASFLHENRAKCVETMQNDRICAFFRKFTQKTNDIYEIRRVFDAFCENPPQIPSYSAKITLSFGEIRENKGKC